MATGTCVGCKTAFIAIKPNQKWCSRKCSSDHHKNKAGIGGQYPGLATGTVGAINELRVCVDLMAKGYEVFRAVSQNCSCDIAILRNGKLLRIEARTGYKSNVSGTLMYSHTKDDHGKQDHFAVALPDDIVYVPPLPLPE